jgi:hypothetical protein
VKLRATGPSGARSAAPRSDRGPSRCLSPPQATSINRLAIASLVSSGCSSHQFASDSPGLRFRRPARERRRACQYR